MERKLEIARADWNEPSEGMSQKEFTQLRDLIHERTGIFLEERKKGRLQEIALERMKVQGLSNYFEYYYALRFGGEEEWNYLVDHIMVFETRFYRNPALWVALETEILPEIISLKRKEDNLALNFWSAGCCTGEEPYTMAMSIAKVLPEYPQWNIKLIGGDISLHALEIAKGGIYGPRATLELPESDKRRFLDVMGEEKFRVKDYLKAMITFEKQNLVELEKLEALPKMDIIICANVMMYFSEKYRNSLLALLAEKLEDHGYLFTGWAEILEIHKTPFAMKFLKGAMCYQKKRGEP